VCCGRRDRVCRLCAAARAALLAAAGQVLGDLERSQEAAQEAFVIAFRKLATLRRPESLGLGAADPRRVALTMVRERGRHPPLTEDIAALRSRDGEWDDRIREVLGHVMKLREGQRQAVLLRYFADMTCRTSRDDGPAASTVRNQIARGIARLREAMKEFDT